MSFREVNNREPLEELYEKDKHGNITAPKKKRVTLSLPTLDLDNKVNLEIVKFVVFRSVVIVALLWFGVTSSGSFAGPAAGKFSGDLAHIFYEWQIGTVLAGIGLIIGYDTIKHFYP
jgi:hypothetical protein